MSKDFRSKRKLLPSEACAHAEGPDLPPQDLIGEDVWNSIMSLPDDVSLRTSNDYGTELKHMHELWESLIDILGETEDVMRHSLLDVADESMACIVNSMIGFYRIAASCLRNSLEIVTHGAYYQRCKSVSEYKNWRSIQGDISFDTACNNLNKLNDVKSINDFLYKKMNDTLFDQKNSRYQGYSGGWARKLYSELSNFVHAKPSYSHVATWDGSTGPIYVKHSFGKLSALYCDTMALTYVMIKLARPDFNLPNQTEYIFQFPKIKPSKLSVYTYKYLWEDEFPEKSKIKFL